MTIKRLHRNDMVKFHPVFASSEVQISPVDVEGVLRSTPGISTEELNPEVLGTPQAHASELVPGMKVRMHVVELRHHPSSDECLRFVRQQNGLLPGLPGLLAGLKLAEGALPHNMIEIVGLSPVSKSPVPFEPDRIPCLTLGDDTTEISMMPWGCSSLGHLIGQHMIYFAAA